MIDITHKSNALRKAVASAEVYVSHAATIQSIRDLKIPKGNVLETARVAALFAVKRTSDVIPDCHPLPVEFTEVRFELREMEIAIEVEVHTIYKTGVEVEAMHGASVAALTIYDMLKPIDKGVGIARIHLKEKKGGKSDFLEHFERDLTAAVVVCSDSVASGRKQDEAGKTVVARLEKYGLLMQGYEIIPDEKKGIASKVRELVEKNIDLIVLTGGTGLSERDVTPEAVRPLLDREIPGMMEAARNYGQQRTPYAMLSRGIAGLIGKTLVIALPGSTRGAAESIDALFPAALHLFWVAAGQTHDKK